MEPDEQFRAFLAELEQEAGVELDEDEVAYLRQVAVEDRPGLEEFKEIFAEIAANAVDEDEAEIEDHPGYQQLVDQVEHDLDGLEKRVGRPLLERERLELVEAAVEQAGRYGEVDLLGPGVVDVTPVEDYSREEQRQFMVERLSEMEPGPDLEREFDMSTRDGKAAYMVARLAAPDATLRTSEGVVNGEDEEGEEAA